MKNEKHLTPRGLGSCQRDPVMQVSDVEANFIFHLCNYCSVLQICPPFCNLSTNRRGGGGGGGGGGLYAGCDIFSCDYTPPDREMFSTSVDAGFVLALPFHHRELEHDCVEVSTRGERGGGGEGGR